MLKFQDNYPLKNVTTLSIGGPAKKFVTVKSQEELSEAIKYAKQEKLSYLLIGGGSNLLIADEGFDGLVIKNEIRNTWDDTSKVSSGSFEVNVKSGTSLQNLVNYTIQNGLSGLQKLAGIPGTVGGAVYGNAGAYGQTISHHIINISALDSNNLTIKQFNNSGFTYRNSIFKQNHNIILEVTFELQLGEAKTLQQEAQDVLEKRAIKYPPGLKCPGSFFKNLVAADLPAETLKKIPQDKIVYGKLPAGVLLEMVGASGQSSDGIEIAPYHANLFINNGNGTAQAFYNLAKTYAQKVKEKFGITLEPEVQLVNLPSLL